MQNNCLAVIPARKGSSMRGKNTRLCDGKELIRYTLDACKEIAMPVMVTTDDEAVMDIADDYTVALDQRPDNLADDLATLDEVIYHIAANYSYPYYILLPPTSPLRDTAHIKRALEDYFFMRSFMGKNGPDSLISVTEELRTIWKPEPNGLITAIRSVYLNRQDIPPYYIGNGAIFISSRSSILASKRKVSGKTIPFVMNKIHSIDIHTEDDIDEAEFWLEMGEQ